MKGATSSQRTWGLSVAALGYVALDCWRENASWLPRGLSELAQPLLWAGLGLAALFQGLSYRHWSLEIRAIPRFVAALLFMVSAIAVEVVMVQFVTVVLGTEYHARTPPLPDTGQWALLALNERLPPPAVALLRARLIELHHYLMLFVMLGFSVLFGGARPPGLGLGARYCFAMGAGRILRAVTFAGTILPSPRPWCVAERFQGSAPHPHPWAQKYFVPYARSHVLLRELLRRDRCFLAQELPSPEYVPDWGPFFQFLVSFVRPADPRGGAGASGWRAIIRPGGGCNDLAYSGHILVAVLTACAWQEAYPGWASVVIWLLAVHSGQREIRERHHYTVDVVAGFYVGMFLWAQSRFVCSADTPGGQELGQRLAALSDSLQKAAKEGDMEKVQRLLGDARRSRNAEEQPTASRSLSGAFIIMMCLSIVLLVFHLCLGG